ncbi:MAG: tRNA 2-thiouridine(34) synthase MnmA [Holophaga sp.]|nr:tRNA 2-thiouridine(34) synthase MnmA [Holophaga sp.]
MTLDNASGLLLEHALVCLRLEGPPPGARILAAMSGGIDSSVMAALLHRGGYEVVGVSMQLFDKTKGGTVPEAAGKCCTLDDFQDARRVAFQSGFPHYVLDLEEPFQEAVIEPFMASYLRGETPSPCIRCNQYLKFRALFKSASDLDCAFVATGHYARVGRDAAGYHLLKAADAAKDQSYFLFTHDQESLARTLFPLAGFSKPEVRQLARELGLHLADKAESQEICFVPGRYASYIEEAGRAPAAKGPGAIRHLDGRLLGSHEGYWRFTVGQRKGIGVAYSDPLYVVRVDPATDTVWVGGEEDLLGRELTARETSWCLARPAGPLECRAKIRSRGAEVAVTVHPLEHQRVRVVFQEPQRAIAPGQAVVFYAGEEVLGGGWIEPAGQNSQA